MSELLIPPFTYETAVRKVRIAEDAWNTRRPENVLQGYSLTTHWRYRSEFLESREAITEGRVIHQ